MSKRCTCYDKEPAIPGYTSICCCPVGAQVRRMLRDAKRRHRRNSDFATYAADLERIVEFIITSESGRWS